MKTSIKITALFMIFTVLVNAQGDTQQSMDIKDLQGTWKIDLRPTPTSDAYYQEFMVEKIEDNTIQGSFYGSPIKKGWVNANWDKVYFAFTTSDATNDYYHSGYIKNGEVRGISYCPNREFVAPWVGKKE